ncbi:MAG: COX15/CtaA family protein [Micavibrio sp.]
MDLSTRTTKNIQIWLYATAFMVFAMAVIGAVTRLTESGLSMVEWKPLIGTLPPLSQAEWERVFTLYQETPEYRHKHSWMELDDFKNIFFWEWFHRLWGRLIGIVYALPLAVFWIKGQIPEGYKGKFLFVLLLGAAQGFMGWFMVMSGLVDRPSVSHYRLCAHLVLAMLIFCAVLWLAFDFNKVKQQVATGFCRLRHGWIAMALLTATIIWGAFTAGLDGGLLYNTWPKMDAHWAPPEFFLPRGFLDEAGGVQFVHRWLAILALLAIASFGLRQKDAPLLLMAFAQVGLGIGTVLMQSHIHIAATHQAGAMILLALMTRRLHAMHWNKESAAKDHGTRATQA